METIAEAINYAVSQQNKLMLDPVATLIIVGIVVTYGLLRVFGKRKSTRRRIAEMEDADFPVDDEWPGEEREHEKDTPRSRR